MFNTRVPVEELEVAVLGLGRERELGVDLRGDPAAVPEDALDLFEAKSFGAQHGRERVPCRVWSPFLVDACGRDDLVVPTLQCADGDLLEDVSGATVANVQGVCSIFRCTGGRRRSSPQRDPGGRRAPCAR